MFSCVAGESAVEGFASGHRQGLARVHAQEPDRSPSISSTVDMPTRQQRHRIHAPVEPAPMSLGKGISV
jgi:hypothetical protein